MLMADHHFVFGVSQLYFRHLSLSHCFLYEIPGPSFVVRPGNTLYTLSFCLTWVLANSSCTCFGRDNFVKELKHVQKSAEHLDIEIPGEVIR